MGRARSEKVRAQGNVLTKRGRLKRTILVSDRPTPVQGRQQQVRASFFLQKGAVEG